MDHSADSKNNFNGQLSPTAVLLFALFYHRSKSADGYATEQEGYQSCKENYKVYPMENNLPHGESDCEKLSQKEIWC